MIYALITIAALLALGALYEHRSRRRDQTLPLPGRLIDAGGYRLHVTDTATPGPTVIILHGAGDSSYSWSHIRSELARFARVVTVDRPGHGASDPGPAPSAAGSAAELHRALQTAGIPGPYVLVGHSLGGLLARLYAVRYPADVAGMIFVDSTHEFLKDDAKFRQGFAMIGTVLRLFGAMAPLGLTRLLFNGLGAHPLYPERSAFLKQISPAERLQWEAAMLRHVVSAGVRAEFTAVYPLLQEAASLMGTRPEAPQFGRMPMAVLTNPGYGDNWIEMHRELAARSAVSVHWISDLPGHNLHMVRPDLVIRAVRHVLDQVVPS